MSEFIRGKTLKTDCELIQLLGIENECWQYDMSRRLDKSYRTIMRRVAELEDSGLLRVVRKERSMKMGKQRKIYGLTFRGALLYLASLKLEVPKRYGKPHEPLEAFKERYMKQKKTQIQQLRKLGKFFEYYGKLLDYEVFKQVPWLVERYGPIVYRIMLQIAQSRDINAISLRELKRRKASLKEQEKLIKKYPGLQKLTSLSSFTVNGRGEWERNPLAEVKEELALLGLVYKEQEERCKQSYALALFQRIAYLKTRGKMHNESLHRLVEQLLLRRRKTFESELDALTKLVTQYH